ncbi:SDR family oxidoreductase [Nocardioides dongkuii]|uniref:SDR family oxidoreductase n=1 Tax=Nocardioides dongkuii TaxID=2760089 RepID=UPI001878BD0A|nr:SDR family NAD(P)-dependent oxidoreductase [Nocardioides dongkuii]
MLNHLEGRTLIVTGAAGGFGRELTMQAAARGANVGACDIDEPALADLAGDRTITGGVDVTDLGAMRSFATRVTERFGAIDVIINNAGVMPLAFYADHAMAADAWSRCIDINIKGVLHGIIAVHDQMMAQGRGHVVNISSVFGNHPVAGSAVYGATKAAVNVLSESLRQESLGAIKVTTIRPTGVPGTGLAAGVLNPEAIDPVLGTNRAQFYDKMTRIFGSDPPADLTSPDSIGYAAMSPALMAEQVLHTIDQPWGVSISDITIRASNDDYLM